MELDDSEGGRAGRVRSSSRWRLVRAVVKLGSRKKRRPKRKRWSAIAESAAKQSKRPDDTAGDDSVMVVSGGGGLMRRRRYDVCLIPYELRRGDGADPQRFLQMACSPGTVRGDPDRTGGWLRGE